MEGRVGFRVMCCDALRLSNHRDGRSEQVPGSRVARSERWRSVATASAVVERREASAPPPNPPPQAGEGKEKRARAVPPPMSSPARWGGLRWGHGGYGTRLSAFRFPFFLRCFPGAAQHAVMRCRTGIFGSSAFAKVPDRRCAACAAHLVRETRRLSARDRDGDRSHHRRHLTKITPGFLFVCLVVAKTRARKRVARTHRRVCPREAADQFVRPCPGATIASRIASS